MKGFVYVICNKAMPGLCKIGYSTKDPEYRAKELANTGVPHPYEVIYYALVDEPSRVEAKVHGLLRNSREGKEWFRISIDGCLEAIKKCSTVLYHEHFAKSYKAEIEHKRRQAEEAERKRKQAEAEIEAARKRKQAQEAEAERKRKQVEVERKRKQAQEAEAERKRKQNESKVASKDQKTIKSLYSEQDWLNFEAEVRGKHFKTADGVYKPRKLYKKNENVEADSEKIQKTEIKTQKVEKSDENKRTIKSLYSEQDWLDFEAEVRGKNHKIQNDKATWWQNMKNILRS